LSLFSLIIDNLCELINSSYHSVYQVLLWWIWWCSLGATYHQFTLMMYNHKVN
jgi:hypothetical protein